MDQRGVKYIKINDQIPENQVLISTIKQKGNYQNKTEDVRWKILVKLRRLCNTSLHFFLTLYKKFLRPSRLAHKEKIIYEDITIVKMELAPLRSMDEFILSKSRFQIPDVNNDDRWMNRIVSNLLYYQTNYFVSALFIFLLVSFLHPGEMLLGIITIGILGLTYYYAQTQVLLKTIKKNHPAVVMFAIIFLLLFIIRLLGCVLVFLSGVILPLIFMIVHASLRLRNIKNKVTNVAETLGVGRITPMGILLDELGIETDLKYM